MGESLRDWILPAVLKEVKAILSHDINALKGTNLARPDAYEWKSDGSLDIHSEKGQRIQLIDFTLDRKPPYTAWVSDSHTKVVASFSVEATKAYKRATSRPFTSGTLGSIFGISKYCLTIDPSATPSRKVIIVIQKFKLVGSEGSPTFGHPRYVEEPKEVHKLLASVKETYETLHRLEEQRPESPSSVKSQPTSPSNHLLRSYDNISTQAPFASQLVPTLSTQTVFSDELNPQSRLSLQPNAPERTEQILSAISTTPLQFINEIRNKKSTSKLSSQASIKASARTVILPASKSAEDTSGPREPVNKLDLDQGAQSGVSNNTERENIQENEKNGVVLMESDEFHPPCQQARELASPQVYELGPNLWEGCARLPRKYVQISKEQRAILERSDSWLSAGVDEGVTHISVPPNVIFDLQSFHERSASKSIGKDQKQATTTRNTPQSNQVVDEPYAEPSGHTSKADSSISHRHLSRMSPGPMVDITNVSLEGDHSQDDDSDEEKVSWAESPPRERHFDHPLYFEQQESQASPTSRRVSISDSDRGSHPGRPLRSVSPCSSHVEELHLPKLPQLPPLKGDNVSLPRSANFNVSSVKRNVQPASQLLSSSQPEMESAVPWGIDDNFTSSNDIRMTRRAHLVHSIPSTDQRSASNLQVARTPHIHSHPPQSHLARDEFGHGRDIDEYTQIDHQSSDPVIPGSIDVEAVEHHRYVASPGTKSDHHDLHGNAALLSGESTSALFSAPARSSFGPVSPPPKVDHSESADDQLHAEVISYSQRGDNPQRSESPIGTHGSFSRANNIRNSRLSSDSNHIQVRDTSSISASQDSVSGPSHTLIPATQPLSRPNPTLSDFEENVTGTLPQSAKRVTSVLKMEPRSSRNQGRVPSSVDLGFSQEESQVVDICAMVRANRREFVRKLSHSSRDSVNSNEDKPCDQISVSSSTPLPGGKIQESRPPHPESLHSPAPSRRIENDFVSGAPSGSLNISEDLHMSCKQAESSPLYSNANESIIANNRVSGAVSLGLLAATSNLITRKDQSAQLNPDQQNPISQPKELQPEHTSNEVNDTSENSSPTLLDRFRASYPTYDASNRRFIKACVYLEWLKIQCNTAPHPSLWDDFIRAWCFEYLDYISQCKPGDKKMSGIEFYNESVSEPKFKKRIITPANLQEALLLDSMETERARKPFRKDSYNGSTHELVSVISARSSFGSYQSVMLSHESAQLAGPQTEFDLDMIQFQNSDPSGPFHNSGVSRKPFFETASQLAGLHMSTSAGNAQPGPYHSSALNEVGLRNRHASTESPTLTPLQSPTLPPIQNTPPSRVGARNRPGLIECSPIIPLQSRTTPAELDIIRVTPTKRRSLPWISSPSVTANDKSLIAKEYNGRTLTRHALPLDTRSSVPGYNRESLHQPSVRQTPTSRGADSPVITVKVAEKPHAASTTFTTSEGSPILGTRVFPVAESHPEEFVTPPLKFQSGRGASISEGSLDPSGEVINMFRDNHSVKRKCSPITSSTPAKRPAFEDCVKKWAPRRKRPSAILKAGSTPGSAVKASLGKSVTRMKPGTPFEPETQDWNEGYE